MTSNDLTPTMLPMDDGSSVPSTPLVEESTNPSIECTETAPTTHARPPQIDSSSVHSKKLTSNVWLEFDKKKIDGKDKATCRSCKKVLNAGSANGTSNLRKHLLSCPRKSHRDPRQMLLDKTKKSSDGSSTLGTYNFDHVSSRTDLANMIVLHEYPLRRT